MIAFSHVGTSDIGNYGDLLYPIVLSRLLERCGVPASVRRVSLLGGTAPLDAGFTSIPLRRLFERGAEPGLVVVGGGDLLRVDADVVAGHYRTLARRDRRELRRVLGCFGALRHVVRRNVSRRPAQADFVARFRARAMRYPAPGPFLLDPGDLPRGSSTFYLSVGVPHELDGPERPRGARALDRARFLWVRDRPSHDKLRRAGVTGTIHVEPDLVVLLGDVFARDVEARRGRALLAAHDVDVARPIVCFQCQSASDDEDEIVARLRRHQDVAGAEIVLLPLGPCHGDDAFARRLAARAGGRFRDVGVLPVLDMLAVIAASDVFVGTSLHGSVTAFSFGIPHLLAPQEVDKSSGFLEIVGAPREHRLASWRELDDRLAWAAGQDRRRMAERAADAKARVRRAVDGLLAALQGER